VPANWQVTHTLTQPFSQPEKRGEESKKKKTPKQQDMP